MENQQQPESIVPNNNSSTPVEPVLEVPVQPAPAKIPVSSEAPAVMPAGSSALPTEGGEQVLLVEDDQFLNSLLKGKLEKAGVRVRLVTDGEMAIDTLLKMNPSPKLILLDLILPKKSGFEVLEEIHTNPQLKAIPVMILSNLGQDDDVEKGKQLGAVDYYVKAKTSIDDLAKKVSSYLNK